LTAQHDNIQVFVVWEPVLPTDWAAPSTAALRRASDLRVQQYWDEKRLLSKAMGEKNKSTIFWDYVSVYRAGDIWRESPPKPFYEGRPVVGVMGPLAQALQQAEAQQNSRGK
jgi:hypothetical protein